MFLDNNLKIFLLYKEDYELNFYFIWGFHLNSLIFKIIFCEMNEPLNEIF